MYSRRLRPYSSQAAKNSAQREIRVAERTRPPIWLLIALVAISVLPAASSWPASYEPIGGLYAIGRIDERILSNRYVDGVTLRFSWDRLEPSEGRYDWSRLDGRIAQARSHRKKVSITVEAGSRTPAWVYTAGARPFSYRWTRVWGRPLCSEQQLPVPWNEVFISKWRAFVRQLGLRYDRDPTVVMVKITGVNSDTGETNLPRMKAKTIKRGGRTCLTSDDLAEWQQLGYSRDNLMAAWKVIADTFSRSFPHKKIAIMTGPNSLPVIDGSSLLRRKGGRIGRGEPDLAVDLINEGIKNYGGQFVVENNALSAVFIWEEVARVSKRVSTGYQMFWNATSDPTCRMTHQATPCPPMDTLQAAIDKGIRAGAEYLEIYDADILNPELQGLLLKTHQRLVPSRNIRPE
jgi:hypothetical protein